MIRHIELKETLLIQTTDEKLEVIRRKINEIIDFLQGEIVE